MKRRNTTRRNVGNGDFQNNWDLDSVTRNLHDVKNSETNDFKNIKLVFNNV